MKICPSIASGDVLNIETTAKKLEEIYQHIHIDIEDGNFINNITFGMKVLKGIAEKTKCDLSVHLMVTNPLQYLEEIADVKPKIVFFHPDCNRYPRYIIESYQKRGIRVGIALNPAIELLSYQYLFSESIQDVLIMMCEPDLSQQRYLPFLEEKVKDSITKGWQVWVDGAVTKEKAVWFEQLGVSYIVMGRAIYA